MVDEAGDEDSDVEGSDEAFEARAVAGEGSLGEDVAVALGGEGDHAVVEERLVGGGLIGEDVDEGVGLMEGDEDVNAGPNEGEEDVSAEGAGDAVGTGERF